MTVYVLAKEARRNYCKFAEEDVRKARLFGPLGSQKLKVTLKHYLWIVLLDERSKCFHFILI